MEAEFSSRNSASSLNTCYDRDIDDELLWDFKSIFY